MTQCVYVIDFGVVVKVGYSQNPEGRMKTLSSQFKLKPLRSIAIETNDAYPIESMVKNTLKKSLKPHGGFSTETFDCSFSDAVKAVCNADDYYRLRRDDENYYKHVYEARLSRKVMEMVFSFRDKDRFIEEAVKEKFIRDGAELNWDRPRASVVEVLLSERAKGHLNMFGAGSRNGGGRYIEKLIEKEIERLDYDSEG